MIIQRVNDKGVLKKNMITAAEKYRWCFEPSCIAHSTLQYLSICYEEKYFVWKHRQNNTSSYYHFQLGNFLLNVRLKTANSHIFQRCTYLLKQCPFNQCILNLYNYAMWCDKKDKTTKIGPMQFEYIQSLVPVQKFMQ